MARQFVPLVLGIGSAVAGGTGIVAGAVGGVSSKRMGRSRSNGSSDYGSLTGNRFGSLSWAHFAARRETNERLFENLDGRGSPEHGECGPLGLSLAA